MNEDSISLLEAEKASPSRRKRRRKSIKLGDVFVELSAHVEDGLKSITDIHGDIFFHSTESDNQKDCKVEIGWISAQVVQVSSMMILDGTMIYECDSHSQDLMDAVETLYDFKTGEYRFDEFASSETFMYLDHVNVDEEFRGKKIALKAICDLINTCAYGIELVFLKPFPTQFAGIGEDMSKDQEVMEATEKLRAYYSKIGFKRVEATDMCVLDWRVFNKVRYKF